MQEMNWITILGIIGSLITILAALPKVYNYCYNCYHFWEGGLRMVFHSGAYVIKGHGVNGKTIYKSDPSGKGFVSYAEIGKQMRPYIIKPFKEWKFSHSFDNIKTPNYPIEDL